MVHNRRQVGITRMIKNVSKTLWFGGGGDTQSAVKILDPSQ